MDEHRTSIILGRFNTSDENEPNWISRNIAETIIHKDFVNNKYSSKHDIALFIMDKAVEFTDFIRPICLQRPHLEEKNIKGTIVGHGLVEHFSIETAELPKESFLVTQSHGDCRSLTSNNDFSSSNLCGGATGDCLNAGKIGHTFLNII